MYSSNWLKLGGFKPLSVTFFVVNFLPHKVRMEKVGYWDF
jgi:hypothetical protein